MSTTAQLLKLSDADLLEEITDDEIEQLLARRKAEQRRITALENELDSARVDLANTDANIRSWLAALRRELSAEQHQM